MVEILHVYARVSSTVQEEQGTSLTSQTEAGIKKADHLGFEVQIWNEGGKSSRFEDLDNRPVLRKLMLKVEMGEVKHLFVYNTDRLSRNQKTWGGIRWKLKEMGVKLYTPTGVIDLSSHLDSLVIGILSEIASYDNALRSERSQIGKLAKVKAGYWMGGPPPFGYQIVERKLLENDDEGKWVRRIYQLFADGQATHKIKNILEENGIRTRRNNQHWSLGSIQKILRNTLYIGEFRYHDKKLDETVECRFPAIVPEELWYKAQDRRHKILERKGQNARTEKFYLLRNLMYCSHCSTPMGARSKPEKREFLYYCPHRERAWVKKRPVKDERWNRQKSCGLTRSLNIPLTNKIVWDAVKKTLINPESLRSRLEEKQKSEGDFAERRKSEQRQIRRLKIELKKIEKALTDLDTEYRLGQLTHDEYEPVFNNIKAIKREVSNDLRQSEARFKQIENTVHWYESVSRIHVDFGAIERRGDRAKRDWLDGHIDRINVMYDDTAKNHQLDIKMRVPLGVPTRAPFGVIPR